MDIHVDEKLFMERKAHPLLNIRESTEKKRCRIPGLVLLLTELLITAFQAGLAIRGHVAYEKTCWREESFHGNTLSSRAS